MGEQDAGGRIDGTGRPHDESAARRRGRNAATWTAVGLLLAGAAVLGAAYLKLDGNIRTVDISTQLGDDRPENTDDGSLDILVLGSDSRAGDNAAYGRDDGGSSRSDTAMVVHVHDGRTAASVVSIPRDTLITRPECTDRDGEPVPAAYRAMFNTAYEVGGPACAVKTVEQMSGIRMDHYVEVDFTGFRKLIDELGGVEVTTTRPIKDGSSHLDLPAGTHTLDGEQSLALVRTRKGVGEGSDLGRIQLQHAFMKAPHGAGAAGGVFTSPPSCGASPTPRRRPSNPIRGSTASRNSWTSRAGWRDSTSDEVQMITLPVVYDTVDRNRVVPVETQAQQVWSALRLDQPIPAEATKDTATGSAEGVVR